PRRAGFAAPELAVRHPNCSLIQQAATRPQGQAALLARARRFVDSLCVEPSSKSATGAHTGGPVANHMPKIRKRRMAARSRDGDIQPCPYCRAVRMLISIGVVALLALGGRDARAQGGPPLITDDPDTPGPGYWEINLAGVVARHPGSQSADLPRVDANYGAGRRVQLKFEVPWVRARNDAEVRSGIG